MSKNNNLPIIAFLGIGLMGLPMASRLIKAGYPLAAWNRTRAKAEALAEIGAHIAQLPSDAVQDADIVVTMLEAGPAVMQVIDNILQSLRPGTLLIDMSSTKQSEAKKLSELLLTRDVKFLDAPVSGGVLGAEAGTLAIMAGGDEADFKRAEPVLSVMGRPMLVGPVGCGQLAKLCNQLIVGGTITIVAEALLLAQAGGADPVAVRAAIRGGFAESRILEVHGQRMLERNFVPGGQVKSQTKDLENVLIAASEANLRLPVTSLITDIYRCIQDTYPYADQAAAVLALEQLNSSTRVGKGSDQF